MIAFLFPGQGSQRPGALRDAAETQAGSAVVAEASRILGIDVTTEDDADALQRTEIVQRNLFLAGVAGARDLEAGGLRAGAVAGHSIGAFAAAVVTGAIAFADALHLVEVRSRAMGDAFPSGFGMGVVGGLTERDATAIATEHGVWIATINAPDQCALSGELGPLDRALEAARGRGARVARRLDVRVPSHTPLMQPVAGRLRAEFARVDVRTPAVPYAANVDGRMKFDGRGVAADLTEGVAAPVRWFDATQMLYERGVRTFIETPPGETLTMLAAAAFPDATAVSCERNGIAAAIAVAARR